MSRRAIGEVHVDFTEAELAAAKAALRRHRVPGAPAPTEREARKLLVAWAQVAFAKAVDLEAKLERKAIKRGEAELRYAARQNADALEGLAAFNAALKDFK